MRLDGQPTDFFTAPAEPLRKARSRLWSDRRCISINSVSHLSKSPLASSCASSRRSLEWPAGLPLCPARHGGLRFWGFAIFASVRGSLYSPVLQTKRSRCVLPDIHLFSGLPFQNPLNLCGVPIATHRCQTVLAVQPACDCGET